MKRCTECPLSQGRQGVFPGTKKGEDGGATLEPPTGTLYWSLGLRRFQGSGLFFRSQLGEWGEGVFSGK